MIPIPSALTRDEVDLWWSGARWVVTRGSEMARTLDGRELVFLDFSRAYGAYERVVRGELAILPPQRT
ncbi:hypothetical protein DN069_33945 [Streptacidiphilus pinicola]|uniref:Uncharacterized protein n=1 Tax=Streptacidiphilus pinicola TaxID=2219663 RepID=A0A2X0K1K2_9ACTN|nr:hypothetical protein DN069_33945 [Streptacidiphilus pinicola]